MPSTNKITDTFLKPIRTALDKSGFENVKNEYRPNKTYWAKQQNGFIYFVRIDWGNTENNTPYYELECWIRDVPHHIDGKYIPTEWDRNKIKATTQEDIPNIINFIEKAV